MLWFRDLLTYERQTEKQKGYRADVTGQEAVWRLPLKEYMFTNTMLISQDFVFVLSKNYTSLFFTIRLYDTMTSEVIRKGKVSNVQTVADEVADWSKRNRVKLNTDKCKELRISFASVSHDSPPVECIKVVTDAKLLGVTISSDLSWNAHITEVIKTAAKRLYFLIQLKRARVSQKDLCLFNITCALRYRLDQKRAMRIICPGMEYQHVFALSNLPSVAEHHRDICKRTFESVFNDSGHKLRKLLPPLHESK